jgi:hypothetical protein
MSHDLGNLRGRTDKRFQKLLDKRIQCLDKHGKRRVGILQFAGVNEKLHGEFQVTISGCPIWPVNPKTIKEFKT